MSMSKIQRISDFQYCFSFLKPEDHLDKFRESFSQSNLGKIYDAIPWDDLIKTFGLRDNRKGPSSIFSPRGKIALMILKNYSCCSDARLIEQLNGNVYYQLFCDLLLPAEAFISNYKIVSQIRCELSESLDIEGLQECLAGYWRPYIKEPEKASVDATCYESSVRFPTNQKLLWEAVDWSYHQMKIICKHLKIKLPRTKYGKWKCRYHEYSRKRRKPSKQKTSLTRGLLRLLEKLNTELAAIEKAHPLTMPGKYYKQRNIIKKVFFQQYGLFTTGEKPQGRIVSLAKSYLRPIVRGKEVKKVEFGAKVNKLQIDGINFIEHLSFNAFNEGTHYQSSVRLAQKLMSRRLKVMGADAIYATNANRRYSSRRAIQTDFSRKGRAGKHENQRKQLAHMITKERASRLEGSFGKEKENYHLKTIKARTQKTEVLWIFFGIHTANALEIGRRMCESNRIKNAA